MIRTHLLDRTRGELSDRLHRKPVSKNDIAKTLPSFVRDKLVQAALAPKPIRAREIDRVIDWSRVHYPQYFRHEEIEA